MRRTSRDPKYGGDPRPLVSNDGWRDPGRLWPLGEPGVVRELWGGMEHLQAVLDAAGDMLVVLKFKREGCQACGSTIARFAAAAETYRDTALFFTVDFNQCRAFCSRSGIKAVPCAHVYERDELISVHPLGPSAWDAFAEELVRIAGPSDAVGVEWARDELDDPWSRVELSGLLYM